MPTFVKELLPTNIYYFNFALIKNLPPFEKKRGKEREKKENENNSNKKTEKRKNTNSGVMCVRSWVHTGECIGGTT